MYERMLIYGCGASHDSESSVYVFGKYKYISLNPRCLLTVLYSSKVGSISMT